MFYNYTKKGEVNIHMFKLKRSKVFAFYCLCVLFFNSLGVAHAGTSKPSSTWNWSNGSYSFHGAADSNNLYTNYKFTGMTKVSITVNNTSGKYDLEVRVKSVEAWWKPDKTVSTAVIPHNGTCTWEISNLDSSKKYYIIFYAPCRFTGSITKK